MIYKQKFNIKIMIIQTLEYSTITSLENEIYTIWLYEYIIIQQNNTQIKKMGNLCSQSQELKRMLKEKEKQVNTSKNRNQELEIEKSIIVNNYQNQINRNQELEIEKSTIVNNYQNKINFLQKSLNDYTQALSDQKRSCQSNHKKDKNKIVQLEEQIQLFSSNLIPGKINIGKFNLLCPQCRKFLTVASFTSSFKNQKCKHCQSTGIQRFAGDEKQYKDFCNGSKSHTEKRPVYKLSLCSMCKGYGFHSYF